MPDVHCVEDVMGAFCWSMRQLCVWCTGKQLFHSENTLTGVSRFHSNFQFKELTSQRVRWARIGRALASKDKMSRKDFCKARNLPLEALHVISGTLRPQCFKHCGDYFLKPDMESHESENFDIYHPCMTNAGKDWENPSFRGTRRYAQRKDAGNVTKCIAGASLQVVDALVPCGVYNFTSDLSLFYTSPHTSLPESITFGRAATGNIASPWGTFSISSMSGQRKILNFGNLVQFETVACFFFLFLVWLYFSLLARFWSLARLLRELSSRCRACLFSSFCSFIIRHGFFDMTRGKPRSRISA